MIRQISMIIYNLLDCATTLWYNIQYGLMPIVIKILKSAKKIHVCGSGKVE